MSDWYTSCTKAASLIHDCIPQQYRTRTFSGIIGDIKVLPPKKALSLISRKKGLGTQYAYLYLTRGIDNGRGYQACAVEALSLVLGKKKDNIIRGNILDVGCAVGVTAGVMGLEKVTGFDLFSDLLHAAKLVDSFTGKRNIYVTADMTKPWPFDSVFDTVVCGLVCHHLKEQTDIVSFFTQANRMLIKGGTLVVTLPSGTVSTAMQFVDLGNAIEGFGFRVDRTLSGIVLSTDNRHSLFWMFVIIAEKVSEETTPVFVNPRFGFPEYRTPVTREKKGKQARHTEIQKRQVKHKHFTLIGTKDLLNTYAEKILTYPDVSELLNYEL